jgi:phosphatidate cytidylyltransferase
MTRIFGALILIVVLAVPAVFGPAWVLALLAALVVPVCMFELFRAALSPSSRALGWISMAASAPFMYFASRADAASCLFILGVASVVLMIGSLFLFEKGLATAKDLVYSIAGLIYPMALIGFWVLLRVGVDGRFWMIFGLVCVFGADSGAFYVGKNLGRHRLAPRLSPKKTWEGFAGGICTAVVLGYTVFRIYDAVTSTWQVDPLTGSYPLWLLAVLAASIGVLDLAGDLTASLFKRDLQIKDMGNLIPGHGGMLDRLDGIIPVGCLLYCILLVAMQ